MPKGITFIGDRILTELGIEPSRTTAAIRCTFCGVDIPKGRETRGVIDGPKRVGMATIHDKHGDAASFLEPIRFRALEAVACPDHCLLIKPILGKDGSIVQQGTKFPDFD